MKFERLAEYLRLRAQARQYQDYFFMVSEKSRGKTHSVHEAYQKRWKEKYDELDEYDFLVCSRELEWDEDGMNNG